MKKKILLLIVIAIPLLLQTSCNSSQDFVVYGLPGTVISTPNNQQLAVVDFSGAAQVSLKRKGGYYHYLLAQSPNSYKQVPFALDYENHSTVLKDMCSGLGIGMLIGGLSFLGGGIGAAIDAVDDVYPLMLSIGGGASAIGGGLFLWGDSPGKKSDRQYNYLKAQMTNNDIIK